MNLGDLIYLRFIPSGTLLTLKIISTAVSLFFVFSIAFFLKKTNWLQYRYAQDIRDFLSFKMHDLKRFEKILNKITKRLQSQSVSEYKLAIIETENLLSEILDRMGYKGENVGDQLKQITVDVLPSIAEIQDVRKISKGIIHDPDYVVTLERAQRFIKVHEKAFQDLNII